MASRRKLTALAGAVIARPFAGFEAIAAAPGPRHFPSRVSETFGLCWKAGPPHEVIADAARVEFGEAEVCVRGPGTVWRVERTESGFFSIDLDASWLPEGARVAGMRLVPAGLLAPRAAFEAAIRDGRLAVDELLALTFSRLARAGVLTSGEVGAAPAPGAAGRAVARAVAILRARGAGGAGLDELAARAGVNKFVLLRAFKRELGITPHAYLIQLRLGRARDLLSRGAPPAEAALAAGFADQSHMGHHFRRSLGWSPRRYQLLRGS
jgi:AraC-like DNA-binding protein